MVKKVDSFKNRFEAALNLRDLKPIDVANRTGISESTLSQYRSGRVEAKSERLVQLGNALNVNPLWLMGLDVPVDVKAEMEQANAPIDHLAIIINEQIKDRALSKALRVYFTLTPEQKKHVINTIYMLGKVGE